MKLAIQAGAARREQEVNGMEAFGEGVSVVEAKNKPPFNNTLFFHDEAGRACRYLTDPLAETYLAPPENLVKDGMLPPQEFEVCAALLEMKLFTERAISYGTWSFFRRSERRAAWEIARQKQNRLMELVNSSREHKAAIRRIVSAMPPDNGGREVLRPYTK
ncbi:MAG: hypothetical protein F8N36_14370 [Desulfovibrio sp.]|uniref:hypothetical protein n=1 Tax=Desulfovibrio sp. TaxID=885 RepID=UPI00135EF44A|nr:hypothetical protein [Desulfovibrio sp.]MTJ94023.1 hypothetical protein [Desulfovibrio sp.]